LPGPDQDGFESVDNLPFQFFPFGFSRTLSAAVNVKHVKLQRSFECRSGIVPCFSAPLEYELKDKTGKRLQVPKHSVIAEIYPLLPVCVGDGDEPGKVEVEPDPERDTTQKSA